MTEIEKMGRRQVYRNWRDYYQSHMKSAEEAARLVKSDDQVVVPVGREPQTICLALAARKEELHGVTIFMQTPHFDLGWYDPGWEDSFEIQTAMILPVVGQMVNERRCDVCVGSLNFDFQFYQESEDGKIDVLLLEVSAPNENGFCSFGFSRWNKKEQAAKAKLVLAEVNDTLIRTYGDNFIHVSDIDYFVMHEKSGRPFVTGQDLLGRTMAGPDEAVKKIAGYVAELIHDGDTVQIGTGTSSEPLPSLGIFEGRKDLGWHSEATPRGVISLVREGVINGCRKTINRGKFVCTAIGGGTPEEMAFVAENPMFELYGAGYVDNVRIISAHDNMVAINNALAVDLTGQITAESIGIKKISCAGGQTAFAMGAVLSNGGRSITVLPSTADKGRVSRIMPLLPEGTVVTVPRTVADYIVTEYGIAHLAGKTERQRSLELINIAHPEFQAELKKEAQKLYWA